MLVAIALFRAPVQGATIVALRVAVLALVVTYLMNSNVPTVGASGGLFALLALGVKVVL